jgi:hypothetical protein
MSKARHDRRIADLEPFVATDAGILARVDKFAEGEESKFHRVRAVGGGARDVPEQFAGQEGDLRPDMGKPPVRGNEQRRFVTVSAPEHAQDPDVDAVLQELVPQVLGDRAVLALLAQRVVLPGGGDQPALSADRGDAPHDRLGVVLQRDQDELPVHRRGLEIVPVRQDQVRVELQSALREAEERADDLRLLEESH